MKVSFVLMRSTLVPNVCREMFWRKKLLNLYFINKLILVFVKACMHNWEKRANFFEVLMLFSAFLTCKYHLRDDVCLISSLQ